MYPGTPGVEEEVGRQVYAPPGCTIGLGHGQLLIAQKPTCTFPPTVGCLS